MNSPGAVVVDANILISICSKEPTCAKSERFAAPTDIAIDCLRMIARLKLDAARTRLLTGFVDTYLRLSESENERFSRELKQLPASEREQVMELTTSWKEEGIQIGLQQGRQQGECAVVLRLLARRLSRVPVTARRRIEKLSVPQLESLSEALLDFTRSADLTRWLEQQALRTNGKHKPGRKA